MPATSTVSQTSHFTDTAPVPRRTPCCHCYRAPDVSRREAHVSLDDTQQALDPLVRRGERRDGQMFTIWGRFSVHLSLEPRAVLSLRLTEAVLLLGPPRSGLEACYPSPPLAVPAGHRHQPTPPTPAATAAAISRAAPEHRIADPTPRPTHPEGGPGGRLGTEAVYLHSVH